MNCEMCGKETKEKVIVKKFCSPKCRQLNWAREEIKKAKKGKR